MPRLRRVLRAFGDDNPHHPLEDLVGIEARRRALAGAFGSVPATRPGVGEDDVLDAHAVLWSARRFVAGTAVAFGDGERDAHDLPMRIVS